MAVIPTKPADWWRHAVIYQVYPRSWADANGDGIGDLPGITARLDHIARLGADAVWLSPFFKSPMKDFGYDVSDYCDVDPMFGTLADFKALLARAHALGLRVMIDQVLSHSSDQHAWFQESRSSRDNPRADWYVWADPRADGTPPNNWLSVFGGSAWQWDTRRRQYYLHNFLASQPDLNLQNPAVRQAILATVRFWLELGVDGLRLDAINFCCHDPALRDNPAAGEPDGSLPNAAASNPYCWQQHVFDRNRPETLDFMRELRTLVNLYPGATTMAEIGDDTGMAMVAQYTQGGDKLHMGYCFEFLSPRHDAPYLHGVIDRFERLAGDGWACWSMSNHDCVRLATRWGGADPSPALLRMVPALQLSLRGAVCLYQGEELGLPEAEIAYEDLQDPVGITMWPEQKGRDGCRTPFAWSAEAPDLGFSQVASTARPWLPLAESHRALAVDRQEADTASLLRHYRRLLAWRREQPALLHGMLDLLPVHGQVLAFVRRHAEQTLLCAFNCSAEPVAWALPEGLHPARLCTASGASGARLEGRTLHFEPHGVAIALLP